MWTNLQIHLLSSTTAPSSTHSRTHIYFVGLSGPLWEKQEGREIRRDLKRWMVKIREERKNEEELKDGEMKKLRYEMEKVKDGSRHLKSTSGTFLVHSYCYSTFVLRTITMDRQGFNQMTLDCPSCWARWDVCLTSLCCPYVCVHAYCPYVCTCLLSLCVYMLIVLTCVHAYGQTHVCVKEKKRCFGEEQLWYRLNN